MAHWNRMTEDKYNAIKAMLRGGAPVEAVATYSNTSKKTVLTVRRTVDFAEYEYQNALKAAALKRAKVMTQTPAQDAAPAAVMPDNADILQKLNDMHALLLRLSGAVEKIVADLYGVG